MRYRPFARDGMAVSALSLALDGAHDDRSATDWRDLMHAAFEEGVNAFEIIRPCESLLEGFAEGAAAVRRNLIFVGLRVADSADAVHLGEWVDHVMAETGLTAIDLLSLDADPALAAGAPATMRALREGGAVRRLAIAGEGELLIEQVQTGAFDALITPFNLFSGWRERHMIRVAVERNMAVIGCEPHPAVVAERAEADASQGKSGFFSRPNNPLAGVGSYAFLEHTPGWNAEQLCIGYALTEPALATVQVDVRDRDHLAMLAGTTERDLPSAVSAQIEMARFSAERDAGAEGQSRRRA